MFEQSKTRASTGKLNRLIRGILEKRGPSSKLGTFAKVYYVAQVAVHPPTIVLVVNKPDLFTANYKRFLMNRFREELPFPEVPIKLIWRSRKRADLQDLLTGAHAREQAEHRSDNEEVSTLSDEQIMSLPDDANEYFPDLEKLTEMSEFELDQSGQTLVEGSESDHPDHA